MVGWLGWGILAAALGLAVWTGVQYARRRPTTEAQMIAAIVIEAALVLQAVLALFALSGADLYEPVTFVSYLIGVLLILPLGFQLARIERSRWGSLSLGFTGVVVAVMTLRLLQLWGWP